MTSPMRSSRSAADRAGCLYLAACAVLAIVWMAWLGPGPGGWPFVGLPWWQWPFEAGFLALDWFIWTLMIGLMFQVTWLLGQAVVMACVLLLIRIQAALRCFHGRARP